MKGFTIPATFELDHGDLIANRDCLSFISKDQTHLSIPYVKVEDVRFHHSDGPDHLEIKCEGLIYDCVLDHNEDENEFFYHHIKEKITFSDDTNEFINSRVRKSKPMDNVMFGPDTISWIMDCKPSLLSEEVIVGALVGRLASDFSHHYNGVLYLTNKRVIFCKSGDHLKELSLDSLDTCRIIYVDPSFTDARGRKSYSVEFNDKDFNVGVQTSRQFKIEAFYHNIPIEKLRIDKY